MPYFISCQVCSICPKRSYPIFPCSCSHPKLACEHLHFQEVSSNFSYRTQASRPHALIFPFLLGAERRPSGLMAQQYQCSKNAVTSCFAYNLISFIVRDTTQWMQPVSLNIAAGVYRVSSNYKKAALTFH